MRRRDLLTLGCGGLAAAALPRSASSQIERTVRPGFEPLYDSGPEQAEQMVREEIARWTPVIKTTGFRME